MNTKLTLTIEKSVIEKAKIYAKENNRSLSEIVGNFLNFLSKDTKKEKKNDINEKIDKIKSLRGSLKGPAIGDDEKVLVEMLSKKYEI